MELGLDSEFESELELGGAGVVTNNICVRNYFLLTGVLCEISRFAFGLR